MEGTHIKKIVKKSLQILLPLVLGAAIMIWMYRGFNFGHVWEVLDGGMDYSWMLLSLVFGVLVTSSGDGGGNLHWLRWVSIPKHQTACMLFLCRMPLI